MTPKQKAKQLIESMAFSCRECDYEYKAKQCSLVAVDEILFITEMYNDTYAETSYWEEVKKEISKF
jgi:hypothetical protein